MSVRAAATRIVLAVVIAALTLGGSGVMAKTIKVASVTPARSAEGAALRRIAVAGFDGAGGPEFARTMAAELQVVQFNNTPYFTLVGNAGQGDRNAPRGLAGYGRSVGAEGVLFGSFQATQNDEAYQGLSLGCVQQGYNGCARMGLVTLPCVRRTIQVSIMTSMMRVSDGQTVYAVPKTASQKIAWCSNQQPPKDIGTMVTEDRDAILIEIKKDLAPSNIVLIAVVKGDPKGLPPDLAKTFKTAINAASSDISTACQLWSQVNDQAPANPWTVYNLGVCAEAFSDPAKALGLYQRSLTLLPSSGDRDVVAAIARATTSAHAQVEIAAVQEKRDRADAAEKALLAEEQRRQQQAQAAEQRRLAENDRALRSASEAQRRQAAAKAAAAKGAQDVAHHQLAAQYGAAAADAIQSGHITKGMTMQQVIAAKGQPSRREKIVAGEEQWTYGAQKIIFTGGRVTYIGS